MSLTYCKMKRPTVDTRGAFHLVANKATTFYSTFFKFDFILIKLTRRQVFIILETAYYNSCIYAVNVNEKVSHMLTKF